MKPCDCKSLIDCDKLDEQAISFNSRGIAVDSIGVILSIEPHVRVKFTHKIFKRLVEWYLEDQSPNKRVSRKAGDDIPH
jgi:hypothetical protein